TENAHSTMRSRYGNVAPDSPLGSASAVASVTIPRMPHQEITNPLPTVGNDIGRLRRTPKRLIFHRYTVLYDMTHAMRISTTARQTARAQRTYGRQSEPSSRVRMPRSCRPISTNASTLSTNTVTSHTPDEGSPRRASTRAGAYRATVIAKLMTVRMAERPTQSATIQTANVLMNCVRTEIGMSCTVS